MNYKKVLYALLALMIAVSIVGCQTKTNTNDSSDGEDSSNPYAKKITISMNVLDAEKTNKTEKDKWFNEKFNIEWKFTPVTWGDWTEKVRAWIAADDIPDVLWWDMKLSHTAEFRAWAQQGAFKEIPADLSRWPELQKMRDKLVSDDKVTTVDGKLYGWPSYRNNPDWLQNAYYPLFAYRRDWAKAVGMYKEGDVYTWDEVKAMIKAVQEQDPGNNGTGNTIGMTSEAWAFPGTFMEVLGYGDDRNGYVKQNGSWTPYMATPEFLQELTFVSDLYRSGMIWKDQMVVGGSEGYDKFTAGRSFMFLGNNSPGWFNGAYTTMLNSNAIASTDQVAPMIILSPKDNKSFWLTQTEDYWTVANISHKVDDAKLTRILDMWNWLASEEGRRFQVAGIPDKDYTVVGDNMIQINWEKNPDGSYNSPYPGADYSFSQYTPATLIAGPTEADRVDGYEAFESIHKFMQTSPDYHVHPLNWDLNTFGGSQYAQYGSFSSDITAKTKEIMAGKDDVAAAWNAYVQEMKPKFQPVIDELNANLK
jgi:putative aldouronate transport system substrate-binding protein